LSVCFAVSFSFFRTDSAVKDIAQEASKSHGQVLDVEAAAASKRVNAKETLTATKELRAYRSTSTALSAQMLPLSAACPSPTQLEGTKVSLAGYHGLFGMIFGSLRPLHVMLNALCAWRPIASSSRHRMVLTGCLLY